MEKNVLKLTIPPKVRTAAGQLRHVGVEIEFANIECAQVARLIEQRFGGHVNEVNPHRFTVSETTLGDFQVELDTRYAHPEPGRATEGSGDRDVDLAESFAEELTVVVGDIGSLWLPVEIVAPPIPLVRLPELDRLTVDLRAAGAEGTDDGLLFAFATQLNPEARSLELGDVLKHLKAYMLLSDWLRTEINPDINRRLLPFANPFPEAYVRHVVNPAYDPDWATLIDDYVAANPTRNRELDMLPLFAEVDAARVHAHVADPRIKARPTFHYRLPDTRLSDPDWGVVTEWNRWARVELLADDDDFLREACRTYLSDRRQWRTPDWVKTITGFFR